MLIYRPQDVLYDVLFTGVLGQKTNKCLVFSKYYCSQPCLLQNEYEWVREILSQETENVCGNALECTASMNPLCCLIGNPQPLVLMQ